MFIRGVEIHDRTFAAYRGEKLMHPVAISGLTRARRPNDKLSKRHCPVYNGALVGKERVRPQAEEADFHSARKLFAARDLLDPNHNDATNTHIRCQDEPK